MRRVGLRRRALWAVVGESLPVGRQVAGRTTKTSASGLSQTVSETLRLGVYSQKHRGLRPKIFKGDAFLKKVSPLMFPLAKIPFAKEHFSEGVIGFCE